jgi:hypothetical protein
MMAGSKFSRYQTTVTRELCSHYRDAHSKEEKTTPLMHESREASSTRIFREEGILLRYTGLVKIMLTPGLVGLVLKIVLQTFGEPYTSIKLATTLPGSSVNLSPMACLSAGEK